MKSLTSSDSNPPSNSIPRDCIPIIEELKKQFNEGLEINTNKLQTLFIVLNKNKYEFSNLANVLENKFYSRLLKYWKVFTKSSSYPKLDELACTPVPPIFRCRD